MENTQKLSSDNPYLLGVSQSSQRLINNLNRELSSPSCGSFDRQFWGWKKRDFQDATLAGAFLALREASKRLWISDFGFFERRVVENICRMQHRNGSFDQAYPNERHPKVGFDFTSVLHNFLVENTDSDESLTLRARAAYRRLLKFAVQDEKYAVVSNHLAHHVYELLRAAEYFRDNEYYDNALLALRRIESHADNEGWYREYSSGDPGYQTRALRYLTKSLDLLEGEDYRECEALCLKSLDFLDQVILPDGTLYSMFGSRNTALLYPSGLERIATKYPDRCSGVLDRVRCSFREQSAILPQVLDFDNFVRLFEDLLEAADLFDSSTQKSVDDAAASPTKEKATHNELHSFGLIRGTINDCELYVHYKFGGAIAVYKNKQLLKKNAGYLIFFKSGEVWCTRNLAILGELETRSPNSFTVRGELFKPIDEDMNPLQLILLRTLNLTLLRSHALANIFRSLLVRRFIVGSRSKRGGVFFRRVDWSHDSITVTDSFEIAQPVQKIIRATELNVIYMATSRYLSPIDLSLHQYEEEEISSAGRRYEFRQVISLK